MVVESEPKREDQVLEYMVSKHATLTNDYKTPDGTKHEHCRVIAEELVILLSKQGKSPYIVMAHGKAKDGSTSGDITPRAFNGRVRWSEHHICCEGEMVYDPMVSTMPVSLEDYHKTAFEEEIELQIWFMTLDNF
jgi:hypothetical protein